MEIIIQTQKNLWSISRQGLRKVPQWNWRRIKETFEACFDAQRKQLDEIASGPHPVLDAIDETVEEGFQVSEKNAEAWRALDDNSLPK